MAVTEKQRHEFMKRIEETLGPEHAETLMELLPPVGWADVATKHDLDALGAATKRDLDALGAATKRDLDALGAATKRDLDALGAATKRDLDALGAATKRDIDALGAATKADLGALGAAIDALGAATKRDLGALEERVLLRTDNVVLEAVGGLRRDVATWLFAGMGIQTATLGLLISFT